MGWRRWVGLWVLVSCGSGRLVGAGDELPPPWGAAAEELRAGLHAWAVDHLRANATDATPWAPVAGKFEVAPFGSARYPGLSGQVEGILKDRIHVPERPGSPFPVHSEASLEIRRYNTDEPPYTDEEFRGRCRKNRFEPAPSPFSEVFKSAF